MNGGLQTLCNSGFSGAGLVPGLGAHKGRTCNRIRVMERRILFLPERVFYRQDCLVTG